MGTRQVRADVLGSGEEGQKKEAWQLERVVHGRDKAAGRRLSFSEKIQGLEVGQRNENYSSIYSSLATYCLQKITFLLYSLKAEHTDERILVVLNKSETKRTVEKLSC